MTDFINVPRETLEQVLDALENVQPESGYGFYRPPNPHDFFPDPECCSPEEIENHKAACAAWLSGTYTPDNSDGWITPNLHITKAPWGIGSYMCVDEDIAKAKDAIRALLDAPQDKDAERYRWLREHHQSAPHHSLTWYMPWGFRLDAEGLDAAIDAAMKEQTK